jgi:hypothetical protein
MPHSPPFERCATKPQDIGFKTRTESNSRINGRCVAAPRRAPPVGARPVRGHRGRNAGAPCWPRRASAPVGPSSGRASSGPRVVVVLAAGRAVVVVFLRAVGVAVLVLA